MFLLSSRLNVALGTGFALHCIESSEALKKKSAMIIDGEMAYIDGLCNATLI